MLDKVAISDILRNRGFSVADSNSKTTRFEDSTGNLSVFVKEQTKKQPLVVHPDNQDRCNELLSLIGVDAELPMRFYHSASMRAFPERLNTGERPTKYGLAFGFETEAAMQSFLTLLEGSPRETLLGDLAQIENSE